MNMVKSFEKIFVSVVRVKTDCTGIARFQRLICSSDIVDRNKKTLMVYTIPVGSWDYRTGLV